MITKQTTQAQRTHQSSGTARSRRKLAAGIGLVAGALLIVLALMASRADASTSPVGLSLPSEIRTLAADLAERIGLSDSTSPAHMRSYSLGIDLPQGADIRELPTGLTDYIRPESKASAVPMRSYPLGIDPPCGVDPRDLPPGLTDYFRPRSATACTQ